VSAYIVRQQTFLGDDGKIEQAVGHVGVGGHVETAAGVSVVGDDQRRDGASRLSVLSP